MISLMPNRTASEKSTVRARKNERKRWDFTMCLMTVAKTPE